MLTSVSVVVPVFNSAPALEELHRRIEAAIASTVAVERWELILVNDGSRDSSWERIVQLSGAHRDVRGLDLTRNWGQHNALLAGIKVARHEGIVTLDDDLQNPPEEIPKLLDALGPSVDLVYGVPIARAQPRYRRIAGTGLRAIISWITGRRQARLGSGFRAFRASLTERLPRASGRHVILDSALRARTDRIGSVAVRHEPRRVGQSNYSLPRLFRMAVAEIAVELPFRAGNGRADPSYTVRAVTEPDAGDGRG